MSWTCSTSSSRCPESGPGWPLSILSGMAPDALLAIGQEQADVLARAWHRQEDRAEDRGELKDKMGEVEAGEGSPH